jgi:phosphomannomutase
VLSKIIKAYDIFRGLVKDEIAPDFAFAVGVAFAKFLKQDTRTSHDCSWRRYAPIITIVGRCVYRWRK